MFLRLNEVAMRRRGRVGLAVVVGGHHPADEQFQILYMDRYWRDWKEITFPRLQTIELKSSPNCAHPFFFFWSVDEQIKQFLSNSSWDLCANRLILYYSSFENASHPLHRLVQEITLKLQYGLLWQFSNLQKELTVV
jgi:hypothetical protein